MTQLSNYVYCLYFFLKITFRKLNRFVKSRIQSLVFNFLLRLGKNGEGWVNSHLRPEGLPSSSPSYANSSGYGTELILNIRFCYDAIFTLRIKKFAALCYDRNPSSSKHSDFFFLKKNPLLDNQDTKSKKQHLSTLLTECM